MFKKAMVSVYLPSGLYLLRPILIDNSFGVDMNVRGFKESISNISKLNYKLAANYHEPIHGLIGADVIQFIKELKIIDCMHGSAFSVHTGVIPFGDTTHFLYPGQVPVVKPKLKSEVNF